VPIFVAVMLRVVAVKPLGPDHAQVAGAAGLA